VTQRSRYEGVLTQHFYESLAWFGRFVLKLAAWCVRLKPEIAKNSENSKAILSRSSFVCSLPLTADSELTRPVVVESVSLILMFTYPSEI